jgi:hypothetical protein
MTIDTAVKARMPLVPIDQVRRLVLFGVLAALTYAVSAFGQQLDQSKECKGGGFSAGFSAGFQRHRCETVIRHVPTGFTARIPFD